MLQESRKGRRTVNKLVGQIRKLEGAPLKSPHQTVVLRELANFAVHFSDRATCLLKADELEARGFCEFDMWDVLKISDAFKEWNRRVPRRV